jgi:mRNA interferase RelE/StbE
VNSVYWIEYSGSARKFLRTQDAKTRARVLSAIEKLPDFGDIKKLQGREGYRLRVGNIRVVYDIVEERLIIRVIDIAYRGSIY